MKRDKLHIVGKNFRPQRVNIFDGTQPGTSQMDNNSRINFHLDSLSKDVWNTPLKKGLYIPTGNLADSSANTMNYQNNKATIDPSFTQTNGSTAVVAPKQESKVPGLLESIRTTSSLVPLLNLGSGLTQAASSTAAKEIAKAATSTAAKSGIKIGTSAARTGGEAVLNGTIGAEEAINGGVNATGAASNAGKFASAFGANKLSSVGKAGVGLAGTAIGMAAKHFLSDGFETDAGNIVSSVGNAVGSVVGMINPVYGAIIDAVVGGAIPGLINRNWGMKTDSQALASAHNAAEQNTAMALNAENLDDIQAPISAYVDPYTGGWARQGDADYGNRKVSVEVNRSVRDVENALRNKSFDILGNAFYNSSAFGGPLETMSTMDNDMVATNYSFMSDYFNNKQRQLAQKNNMNNIFGTPRGIFALGGDVQTHGSDFSTGLTRVDAGGSHESNPNDGVQMGVDSEGTPNLVEEGEAVFNDYVYSNRINLSKEAKEHFKFPKKKDITYAEAAKRLEKEASERPNDPISIAGLKAAMADLADAQEKQKAEMEAQRAKEAFEALSPEEQAAVMQNAAQQEAMAQQAAQEQAIAEQQAMQQPTPEEQAIMQQQMMQADGSQAMVGQEPQFAEGGHLFPWGGIKEMFNISPRYAASRTAGFIPYTRDLSEEEVLKREQEDIFKAWTDYVNNNWDTEEVQDYLKALDNAAGGNHLFDKNGKMTEKAKEYFNHARTKNHKWGYYHLTPTQLAEAAKEAAVPAKSEQVYIAGDNSLTPVDLSTIDDSYTIEDFDGVKIARKKPTSTTTTVTETAPVTETDVERDIVPVHRKEWPRYAGLFGPAVGLGMQALGIGRPDTSGIDAAISAANGPIAEADYKPLGNYMTYRPFDRLFYANQLNGRSLATDRMLMNTNSPSRSANLLANAYNTMLAQGNLYRQGEEYNDALEKQVAEFNRGTDQFNADAYNRTSQFNADARNRARQYGAQVALQGAAQKMDADAGWYNGLYGNVSGLFKGLGDIGRENAQWNMVSDMWADGLGGIATKETNSAKGHLKREKRSDGGKLKKKRGLTF